jgi:AraC-like DNA-binding protein
VTSKTTRSKAASGSAASTTADSSGKELFADLLHSIYVSRSRYFRPSFRAPWSCWLDGSFTAFHVVTRGTCWIQMRGLPKPLRLSAGDFVVVPRGTQHVVLSTPGTEPVNFFEVVRQRAPNGDGVFSAGGHGRLTKLICGGMQFENSAADALLAALPPLIQVKGRQGNAQPWLRAAVAHLLEALKSEGPDRPTVFARLADILFIQAVRAYLDQNADLARTGWLAALHDKRISRAVGLLHANSEQGWTVAALADRSALSRSAFSERFLRTVGVPPHRYLARLRMNKAAQRLRHHSDSIAAIAASAGYASLASFSKAFKRQHGVGPKAFRKSGRIAN